MSLNQEKQLFLQALISRRIVDVNEAKQIFDMCHPASEESIDSFIKEINTKVKRFHMKIVKAADEVTGEEYYAFVNLIDSDITKLSSIHKKEHFEYLKKIISVLFDAEDRVLSRNAAINLCHDLAENNIKMKLSEAESLLDNWISEKYFALTENGRSIYIGVRSIAEMQPYLKETFPANVLNCNLCKTMCVRGVECVTPNCEARFHFQCAKKCYERGGKCVECDHAWSEEFWSASSNEATTSSFHVSGERNLKGKRKRN